MFRPLRFAVVTPTLNAKEYLVETVESVVSQSSRVPVNYLVVDGGSTDGTIDYLNTLRHELGSGNVDIGRRFDINFDYITESDAGIYDALAKGFSKVVGDIFCYINASDFFLPNAFKTVSDAFLTLPNLRWLTGMNSLCDEDGSIFDVKLPYKYSENFIRSGVYGFFLDHIQQESTFWHSDLLKAVNFQELRAYRYAGDYYLWRKFSYEDPLYIADAQLGCFRVHKNQLSSDLSAYRDEMVQMIGSRPGAFTRMVSLPHRICWRFPNDIKRFLSDRILKPDFGDLPAK